MLGLLQLAQKRFKLGFAAGEIGQGRVLIHREAAARAPQVAGQPRGVRVGGFQRFQRAGGLGQLLPGLLGEGGQPLFQHPMAHFALGPPEQHHPQHRHQRNDDEPGDLGAVVHLAVEQVDHHDGGEEDGPAKQVGHQPHEPAEDAEQQPHLQTEEEEHQPGAAKNDPDHASLALLQQPEAAVLHALDVVLEFFVHVSPPAASGAGSRHRPPAQHGIPPPEPWAGGRRRGRATGR